MVVDITQSDTLESLDRKSGADAPQAWSQEIERRLAEVKQEQVQLEPWDRVRESVGGRWRTLRCLKIVSGC